MIMDCPTEDKLHLYRAELDKNKVTHVVRACEPSYPVSMLEDLGMIVHELGFPDGKAPPDEIISTWLQLCKSKDGETIAVHCVAGLGRAPMLVAVAMIEGGMEPLDAVGAIRNERRGAFNASQIQFLEEYKAKSKKGSCAVM